MSVKIIANPVHSWEQAIGSIYPMALNSDEFETSPPSWATESPMDPNHTSGNCLTVPYATHIDFDYKVTGGGGANCYAMVAVANDPETQPTPIVYQTSAVGWTHVSEELTAGLPWLIYFGTFQDNGDPIQLFVDNIQVSPTMKITPGVPYCGRTLFMPAGLLTFSKMMPPFGPSFATIPNGVMTITKRNPCNVWELSAEQLACARLIYLLTLTGDEDGQTDVIIPMGSFQSVNRNGDPTYLSCVIPNSLAWVDDIILRPGGDIVINIGYIMANGKQMLTEIVRVNYESLQIFRGARSDSAILSGHKTLTSTSPKEWTIHDVSYYGLQAEGKRYIRAAMDLFLRAGDTVYYGTGADDNFIVGEVTYIVSPSSAIMQVKEA